MLSVGVNIFFLIIIVGMIWKYIASNIFSKLGFSLVVILKIAFAVFSCYYYSTGDIQVFQKEGLRLTALLTTNFEVYKEILLESKFRTDEIMGLFSYWSKPRALFMVKILSILNFVSGGNIFMNAIYFSLINLFSIFYFLEKVSTYAKPYLLTSAIVSLFIPSILFNTSGLEKEVLVMSGIYVIFGFGISLHHKRIKMVDILLFLMASFLVFKIKYYYIAVIFPLGIAFLISHFINHRLVKYFLATLVISVLIYFTKYLNFALEPEWIYKFTVKANSKLLASSEVGMTIPFQFTTYSFLECIQNLPIALVYGLFGPFIWEFKNMPMLYIGVENLIFLFVTIYFIIRVIRKQVKITYFGITVLLYVISLAILLAFYSPNFGTLTRYKIIFLPFMYLFVSQNLVEKYINETSIVKKLFK